MGMTIDKAIENNKNLRMYMKITDKESEYKFLKENYEALDTLIDIAHKYQKIKEQVDIAIDKENFAISGARLIQIREIINGNND